MRHFIFFLAAVFFCSASHGGDCLSFLADLSEESRNLASQMEILKIDQIERDQSPTELRSIHRLKELIEENSLNFNGIRDLALAWNSLDATTRDWEIAKNVFAKPSYRWMDSFLDNPSIAIFQIVELVRLGSVVAPTNSFSDHLARYARIFCYRVSEEMSRELEFLEVDFQHTSQITEENKTRLRAAAYFLMVMIGKWPSLSPAASYIRYDQTSYAINPYSVEPSHLFQKFFKASSVDEAKHQLRNLIYLTTDEDTEEGMREFARWLLQQIFETQVNKMKYLDESKIDTKSLNLVLALKAKYLKRIKLFDRHKDEIYFTE